MLAELVAGLKLILEMSSLDFRVTDPDVIFRPGAGWE